MESQQVGAEAPGEHGHDVNREPVGSGPGSAGGPVEGDAVGGGTDELGNGDGGVGPAEATASSCCGAAADGGGSVAPPPPDRGSPTVEELTEELRWRREKMQAAKGGDTAGTFEDALRQFRVMQGMLGGSGLSGAFGSSVGHEYDDDAVVAMLQRFAEGSTQVSERFLWVACIQWVRLAAEPSLEARVTESVIPGIVATYERYCEQRDIRREERREIHREKQDVRRELGHRFVSVVLENVGRLVRDVSEWHVGFDEQRGRRQTADLESQHRHADAMLGRALEFLRITLEHIPVVGRVSPPPSPSA